MSPVSLSLSLSLFYCLFVLGSHFYTLQVQVPTSAVAPVVKGSALSAVMHTVSHKWVDESTQNHVDHTTKVAPQAESGVASAATVSRRRKFLADNADAVRIRSLLRHQFLLSLLYPSLCLFDILCAIFFFSFFIRVKPKNQSFIDP